MKRQIVALIWAAVALFLVLASVAGYYVWSGSVAGYTKSQVTEAFSCISTEIEEYTVSDKTGSYTLEKEDGVWRLKDKKSAKLDQTAVEKMVAAASKITAVGTVSRKDLESFDMSDAKTVRLDIDDGEDAIIRFLGTNKNLCAFRVSDDRKTYVIYESARDILAPSLDSLMERDVFPYLAKTETLPTYYKYTDYNGDITEIRLKTNAELAIGKNNVYTMERPYRREVDDELFEQNIAVKIPAIKANTFVKNPSKDLAVYGLDKGSCAELTFKWDGKTETLLLGKSQNGETFAEKLGKDEIFTVKTSLLEFLQIDPFFVIDGGILKAEPEHIVGIKVVNMGETFDITTAGQSESGRKYFINGKAASSSVFEDIIESISDMSFKNDINTVPKDTKDIVVTVKYDTYPTLQTISLVKVGENSYAVFSDGKAEFEVEKQDVEKLMKKLKEASNNPMKRD